MEVNQRNIEASTFRQCVEGETHVTSRREMSGVEAANAAIAIRCYPRKLLRSRAASFILSPLNGNKASDLAHLPRAPYLFFSSKMQTTYKESARITTVKGARTSFFSPNL